jgi:phosphohistidine phosphatase
MRTLYLLRHAKSSWKEPSLSDFDRPLKKRGREAAAAIGRVLKSENPKPSLVICSPAVRTRETIEIVLISAGLKAEVRYDERIYEAELRTLVEVVVEIDEATKAVLMVGHNPGMEALVQFLIGQSQQMPTAALAKTTLASPTWNVIAEGKARLEWLVTPKDLPSV